MLHLSMTIKKRRFSLSNSLGHILRTTTRIGPHLSGKKDTKIVPGHRYFRLQPSSAATCYFVFVHPRSQILPFYFFSAPPVPLFRPTRSIFTLHVLRSTRFPLKTCPTPTCKHEVENRMRFARAALNFYNPMVRYANSKLLVYLTDSGS